MYSRSLVALLSLVGVCGSAALAGPINSIVVYGDSLSDNGNVYRATGQPGPPYYMGRVSNGPVAVEQLATTLGATLVDYAYAGATTGIGNSADGGTPTSFGTLNGPGLITEYATTKSTLTPFLGGLFIVWGGPDDLLSPSPLDAGNPAAIISRAVSDLLAIVAGLRSQGATDILVPGMVNLGLTPYYASSPITAAAATAASSLFNAELQAALTGTGATYFNTGAVLNAVVANPSSYGFTDVSDPCFTGTSLCSNPNQYLFFDSLHPTTAADAILAADFAAAVSAPEPSYTAFCAAAFLVFAGFAAARKPRFR